MFTEVAKLPLDLQTVGLAPATFGFRRRRLVPKQGLCQLHLPAHQLTRAAAQLFGMLQL